jgi:hypothetical protein
MCGLGFAGGSRTAVNQGGGSGAQSRQRCSGVLAHQRRVRGGTGAQGKLDGPGKHLGVGGSSRGGGFLRQTEAATKRSTATGRFR